MSILTKFSLTWNNTFRRECLDMKSLRRMTDDGHQVIAKSHMAFGQGDLKRRNRNDLHNWYNSIKQSIQFLTYD